MGNFLAAVESQYDVTLKKIAVCTESRWSHRSASVDDKQEIESVKDTHTIILQTVQLGYNEGH